MTREHPAAIGYPPYPDSTRDFRPLFDPQSVVVFGAADDPAKWGNAVATRLLRGRGRRPVFFVSSRREQVLGERTYDSVADLPIVPELAVLVVPPAALEAVVDAVLEAGVKAVVALTAGLGEAGGEGAVVEARIATKVCAAGATLLGPNCMGLLDFSTELEAAAWIDLPRGDVALVSQSGNLALDLGRRATEIGFGFSRFVSLGNQADLDGWEVLADCLSHEATKLVAVYAEEIAHGRRFAAAAADLVAAGKPVVLLGSGATEAGSRAALSHTGSLVGGRAVLEAASRAAGILLVRTPREMAEMIAAARALPRPRGPRAGIVTTGGGNGVIAADVVSSAGLTVPAASAALAGRLRELAPGAAAVTNPVDLVGSTLDDPWCLVEASRILLESGEIDSVILTGSPLAMWEGSNDVLSDLESGTVPDFVKLVETFGAPVVLNTDRPSTVAATAGRDAGLVIHADIESSAMTVAGLERAARPDGIPAIPTAGRPAVSVDGYWQAREIVSSLGIDVPSGGLVADIDDALTTAERIGYPVVLKAVSLLHKSDAGGVVLGIASSPELAQAYESMQHRLSPPFALEKMASSGEGVELIVGARRDPSFGPIAMVGIGGILTELIDDTAVGLGPLRDEDALRLLARLRCAPLLHGMRGRPPLDVTGVARAASALSVFAASHPEISEIEINPLLVTPSGVIALDARGVACEEGDR